MAKVKEKTESSESEEEIRNKIIMRLLHESGIEVTGWDKKNDLIVIRSGDTTQIIDASKFANKSMLDEFSKSNVFDFRNAMGKHFAKSIQSPMINVAMDSHYKKAMEFIAASGRTYMYEEPLTELKSILIEGGNIMKGTNIIQEITDDIKSKFIDLYKSVYLDEKKDLYIFYIILKKDNIVNRNSFYDYLDYIKPATLYDVVFKFIKPDLENKLITKKIL
jgi:hypothetical protein